jgi:hypothetical protein
MIDMDRMIAEAGSVEDHVHALHIENATLRQECETLRAKNAELTDIIARHAGEEFIPAPHTYTRGGGI